MTRLTIRSSLIRFGFSTICGALLGAYLGFAFAQEPAGTLDTQCVGQCTADGYEAEFCGRVCWIPDPEIAARAYPVDYPCFSSCRDRGGKVQDCRSACRKR